jgi:glucokinase
MTSSESFSNLILGFDIGGTKTGVVIGDFFGNIYDRREFLTPAEQPFEVCLQEMIAAGESLLQAGAEKGLLPPVAVSAAVGGPLDIERGIIYSPPHLPTWDHAPLKESLAAYYQLPVFIEHDGNAGALAEFYFGAGQGVRNLVYLTLGTGLGAGIILDGQIFHGTTDTAGEVGHIRIAEDGPLEYGKAGSWEGYCSASGLAQMAAKHFPDRWPVGTAPAAIIESALQGDEDAVRLVVEMGEWLGKGLAVLVDLLNPEVIVVGTLGVVLGNLLLEPARRVMQQEALPLPTRVCRVSPGKLGKALGDTCALMAAIDAASQGRFSPPGSPEHTMVVDTLRAGLDVRQITLRSMVNQITASGQSIIQALKGGHKVLVFGNGGSAAAAQHLAGELAGRYKAERQSLPCVALTADSSLVTCIGNDYGFEHVFSRQIQALAQPDDIAIGITTSGRSKNVLAGLQAAQDRGLVTIALTGQSGLQGISCDFVLGVPSEITARIQEEHDAILHAWCEMVDFAYSNAR